MRLFVVPLGIAGLLVAGCVYEAKTGSSSYRTAPAFFSNFDPIPETQPKTILPAGRTAPPTNGLPAKPSSSGRNPPPP